MKKKILMFILALFLFLPITVKASEYGIQNFYIDATVQDNGDLLVKETYVMNGSFNGSKRTINFKNDVLSNFDPNSTSYQSSILNNGDSIVINKIGGIEIPYSYDFTLVNGEVENFSLSNDPDVGDYGVYTVQNTTNGINLTIYSPSYKNKAFYIEYVIKNVAVKWNDIGELNWSMFSNESTESVKNLEVYVHLPNNKNITRVWTHGSTQDNQIILGENKIEDSNTLYAKFINIEAKAGIDFRAAFDSSVIANSSKVESYNILDKIVAYETKLADEANEQRKEFETEQEKKAETAVSKVEKTKNYEDYDEAETIVNDLLDETVKAQYNARLKVVENEIVKIMMIEIVVNFLLFIAWVIFFIFSARKYRKEYIDKPISEFKEKYFRDIPSDYSPSTVEYLLTSIVTNKSISAGILDLIRKKLIKYDKQEKTYLLTYTPNDKFTLTSEEQVLVKWLFEDAGTNGAVTLKEFTDYGGKHRKEFLDDYNNWYTEANNTAKQNNFYDSTPAKDGRFKLVVLLSFVMGAVTYLIRGQLSYNETYYSITTAVSVLSVIVALFVYFVYTSRQRYTQFGINEKSKWLALKNFLNDFGHFSDKELPDIILWERYLVFAVIFGCADKLRKQMEIKYAELYGTSNMDDIYLNNAIFDLNRSLDLAVGNAYTAAALTSSSNSSFNGGGGFGGGFSSGGGFGGGSSGGGGFGGGGGGVGRF